MVVVTDGGGVRIGDEGSGVPESRNTSSSGPCLRCWSGGVRPDGRGRDGRERDGVGVTTGALALSCAFAAPVDVTATIRGGKRDSRLRMTIAKAAARLNGR